MCAYVKIAITYNPLFRKMIVIFVDACLAVLMYVHSKFIWHRKKKEKLFDSSFSIHTRLDVKIYSEMLVKSIKHIY